MIYIAYIVFIFTLLQFANVVINLIFLQTPKKSKVSCTELVSILIPARNEEANIEVLLKYLHELRYKHIEIIVFDDQSTDRTAEVVKGFTAKDRRIRLMQSKGLEKGWLGKNYACYSLATQAKGKYFLFIDADVVLKNSILEDAVYTVQKYDLGLLSIFPKQLMLSKGEKTTVPVMNYILISLLPLIFVRISPFTSHSAANGQFMMFTSTEYKKLEPYKKFKNTPVEDISIARYYKKNKVNVSCMLGNENILCRMYKGYNEAVNGFSKNVLMFFGNSPVLALLFWLISTLGFIPILLYRTDLFVIYITIVLFTRILVSVISKQNVLDNMAYLLPQQYFLIHVIIKAIRLKFYKNYIWKGRRIYS